MRKLVFAASVVIALATAGFAVARGIDGAKSARAVAGTFTATAASTSTKTCTTTDGNTIDLTTGRYTGSASGDPDLTGPVTFRTRSVINTTAGVGTVAGALRVNSAGRDTTATFTAVYDHGNIAGLAVGQARTPRARLVANLSAAFSESTGFTSGKLGGGTAGGSAVELVTGKCAPSHPKPEKSQAHGSISALSSSSITVAGLSCAIPSDKSARTAKFKVGDRVEIHCSLAGNQNTLTSIGKRH
ncbi:MAG: hypothetical protein ACRDM1_08200 [Gaiellaceae bacterium]